MIDEIVDSLINEEWQEQIQSELEDILPHARNKEEALGALEQVMGELTDYQKEFAMVIISGEDNG